MTPTCIATRSAAALLLSESSRWCVSVQAACSSWQACTLADSAPLLPLQVHITVSHNSQTKHCMGVAVQYGVESLDV